MRTPWSMDYEVMARAGSSVMLSFPILRIGFAFQMRSAKATLLVVTSARTLAFTKLIVLLTNKPYKKHFFFYNLLIKIII